MHSPISLRALAVTVSGLALLTLSSPVLGQATTTPEERPSIVATTPFLGWAVSGLVGDAADVTVLMGSNVDPHEWQPSARDVVTIHAADLVVANGATLEAALRPVLDDVRREGIPVFEAIDHVAAREATQTAVEGDAGDEDAAHAQGASDPHFWTDPLAMRDVVGALDGTLSDLGFDTAARADDMEDELSALDGQVRSILAVVPPERRHLVTGHESLGYFADRYGFELVGAVIPGLSSQGDVSARQLATLVDIIQAQDVPAIFAEVGTSAAVAEAIAEETGATVVELAVEQLPEDGSYATYLVGLASTIVDGLTG